MSAQRMTQQSYLTYIVKAITNDKILPRNVSIGYPPGSQLSIIACRGEHEPASFCVHASENIKDLMVTATGLQGQNALIPATAVDIRVVKCWFQSGVKVSDTKQRVLVPELLLKDDKLIRVDLEDKQNYLRDLGQSGKETYVLISGPDSDNMKDIRPRDAKELQPVNIQAGETRQFWVTLQVPEDAVPGDYKGQIHLIAAEVPPSVLTLRVRVLPFSLEKPRLRYSLYYRGRLTLDGKGSISSEEKSPEQYESEMRNLKDHGVEYPTVYQPYDEILLPRVFEIRDKVGLPKGPLFTCGIITGNPTTVVELEALKRHVEKWVEMAKRHGYDEAYVYGIDEAKGELLKTQRAAWRVVHEARGKVFAACSTGAFELMGDLLDLAIYYGPPLKSEAAKYHSLNHEIFCYANPQVGVEQPETYRRNFGLVLWKSGYDGAMDYAYQHSFNHGWNDFDYKIYRDLMFSYPTVNGVIDTLQWEGFREGVDDVRYLTTLLKAIEKASTQKQKLAEKAKRWVDDIDVNASLDDLRQTIIDWIIKLQ